MTEYENKTSWECLTVKIYTNNLTLYVAVTQFTTGKLLRKELNSNQKVIDGNIYYKPYSTVDNFNIFMHEFASFIEMKKTEHKH